jgi:polysaccharide pyruvyl transferase WcaK-like protein
MDNLIMTLHLIEKWMLRKVKQYIQKSGEISHTQYRTGEPLKILIIGYSGKKNVGAEVRCAEIIKQIKSLNLITPIEFGVLTLDPAASQPFYSNDIKLIKLSSIFFDDLLKSCSDYHMGILAEGSCLTSVTSNVAALFFICAAGMLKAQNKLCIGYGVEGGPMPEKIFSLASKQCSESYFIARTENSKRIFDKLGIHNHLGTDTAWTIEPHADAWAINELKSRFGVDRSSTLIGISPMNPFIRPIYPSILRYLKGKLTGNWYGHYDKIYFYTTSHERSKLYQQYLTSIHLAIQAVENQCHNKMVPIYIEMEPMDKEAVDDLKRITQKDGIVLSASDYNGVKLTALIRQISLLITSRYHAHVLSMPAGVPCVGISKDSRLTDIFHHNGLSNYCISTHDAALMARLPNMTTSAYANSAAIRQTLIDKVPYYLQIQNEMGEDLKQRIMSYIKRSCVP